MLFRDISFQDPKQNLAFDQVLLKLCDGTNTSRPEHSGDREYLRFWESPTYFVVLGRIGKEMEDVHMDVAASDGIPVLRRSSGGGTVVQGPGCLNYSIVLSKDKNPVLNDLRGSYAWISQKVTDSLKTLGVDACFRPISDIALSQGDLKFSGNAQHRGKTHILHHGTILYDFNLDLVSKYLKMPKDIPEYRKARSHKDFITNIYIKPAEFKQAFARSFGITESPQPLTAEEASSLREFSK
jgi:lipoate---protein ligase